MRLEISSGKTKSLFAHRDADKLVMQFRDDITADNGLKSTKLLGKGAFSNRFNAHIMQLLEKEGIKTHFLETKDSNECIVKKLHMIPIECVVRNVAAGSFCKRLPVKEGTVFEKPMFEFFLKNDDYGDPLLTFEHVEYLDLASPDTLKELKQLSIDINRHLKAFFSERDLTLVDFKLEFGLDGYELCLGDEFTPDSCRVWTREGKSLDKDRFRKDMGKVLESYRELGQVVGL